MQIREVIAPRDIREFLNLPVRLYHTTPAWIRPLDADVENVFDQEKNKKRFSPIPRQPVSNHRCVVFIVKWKNQKIKRDDNKKSEDEKNSNNQRKNKTQYANDEIHKRGWFLLGIA